MRKTALVLPAALFLMTAVAAPMLKAADEQAQSQAPEFSYKFRRGGSFSLEPALWIQTAPLDKVLYNALGYNANFDIGVSPDFSVTFGGGYYNQRGRGNSDYYLVMAPVWAGVKSKNQFLPLVEVFWEIDAELVYEKSYLIQSSSGAIENLDGAGVAGAGFDVWLTRWLLMGFETRLHLVVDDGQVFPFTQMGIRVGIRG